jgi:hypothetical protein
MTERARSGRVAAVGLSVFSLLIAVLPPLRTAHGEELPAGQSVPAWQIARTTAPIRVDGHLDDAGWSDALTVDLPYETMPGENIPAPVRTVCKITYDENSLYLAFRAYDPKPDEIRARVTDRDAHQADDAVGVFLDPFNDERRSFEFLVNPLGVQTDLQRSDVSDGEGDPEDPTWDAIWDSAGRLTGEGYEVEMAIPFTALRFPRTQGVQTWGITLFRNYPRDVRHQIASNPYDRNRSCMICQYPKVTGFVGIAPGRSLEFDPTLTVHRTDELEEDETGNSRMDDGPVLGDVGLSMRWGVTPNLSLNGAINPDFSQIEADAAQLNVNTRYALYYPEKRPFFLEGADFFRTTFNIVHTRTVADPIWGLKATGKEGMSAVGAFATRDHQMNLIFPSNQSSEEASYDREVTGTVFRYRMDVGDNSTLGLLGTDREADDYYNRVFGGDGHVRLRETETIRFQVLGSSTRYPESIAEENGQPLGSFDDVGGVLGYEHDSRNWNWALSYADLGKEFRADAGYVPRVDTREAGAEFGCTWFGDADSWFTEIGTSAEAGRVEDHDGTLTDLDLELKGNFQGRMQSYLLPVYERKKERYYSLAQDGQVLYDQNWYLLRFGARPSGRFNFWGVVAYGDAIDYENGRPGKKHWGGPGFSYDIGRHFQFYIDHTYEALKLDENDKRLYLANLVQSRLVYQMNVRTFARALVQFTDISYQQEQYVPPLPYAGYHELFSQLLFAYKVNPQTVFYLGYSETRTGEQAHEIRQVDRTVFGKIGYAWLI